MEGLQSAIPKDGLFEPFQAEKNKDDADHKTKILNGDPFDERYTESGNDNGERGGGSESTKE